MGVESVHAHPSPGRNWSHYDEADGCSFDVVAKVTFADWERVTHYRNGVLIWGAEL